VQTPRGTLLIACGALGREIAALRRANGWQSLDVRCLPAQLHNRPERIAPAVRAEIAANRHLYAQIFVVYADCGTGGALDAVLKEEGVERLPGAHCYEFLATPHVFAQLCEVNEFADAISARLVNDPPSTVSTTDRAAKSGEERAIPR